MIIIKISDNIIGDYEPEIGISGEVSESNIRLTIKRLEYAIDIMKDFYYMRSSTKEGSDVCAKN